MAGAKRTPATRNLQFGGAPSSASFAKGGSIFPLGRHSEPARVFRERCEESAVALVCAEKGRYHAGLLLPDFFN